jgi:hypothetical protein
MRIDFSIDVAQNPIITLGSAAVTYICMAYQSKTRVLKANFMDTLKRQHLLVYAYLLDISMESIRLLDSKDS